MLTIVKRFPSNYFLELTRRLASEEEIYAQSEEGGRGRGGENENKEYLWVREGGEVIGNDLNIGLIVIDSK